MIQRSPASHDCRRIAEAGENMRLEMAGKPVVCVSVQGGLLCESESVNDVSYLPHCAYPRRQLHALDLASTKRRRCR